MLGVKNADCFNMDKSTDFKFDDFVHVPRGSSDMTSYIISERGCGQSHVSPKIHLADISLSAFYSSLVFCLIPCCRLGFLFVLCKIRVNFLGHHITSHCICTEWPSKMKSYIILYELECSCSETDLNTLSQRWQMQYIHCILQQLETVMWDQRPDYPISAREMTMTDRICQSSRT